MQTGSEAFSSKNPALMADPPGLEGGPPKAVPPSGRFIDEPGLNQRRNRDKGVEFGEGLPHPARDLSQGLHKSDNVPLSKGDCYE
jgi:hypothetical protein